MLDSQSSRQCPGPGGSPGLGKVKGLILEITEPHPSTEVGRGQSQSGVSGKSLYVVWGRIGRASVEARRPDRRRLVFTCALQLPLAHACSLN